MDSRDTHRLFGTINIVSYAASIMTCILCLLVINGCAEAVITRVPIEQSYELESSDPEELQAASLTHYYRGESAVGFHLAEKAHRLAPEDQGAHFAFTIGMLQTQQNERIVEEGLDFFRVDALDVLGRRNEAFELANKLAGEGFIGNLFTLYNRANRSQELVEYLEKRWPDLSTFETDHPHSGTGYGLMAQVALAYSNMGNSARYGDALSRVERAMSTLSSEGVDNMVFMMENAVYLALAGSHGDAITQMEAAVKRGLRGNPDLDWSQPIFASMADTLRFIALRTLIADKVNEQREILGLDPIDRMASL